MKNRDAKLVIVLLSNAHLACESKRDSS
jgi:hypothetical protein